MGFCENCNNWVPKKRSGDIKITQKREGFQALTQLAENKEEKGVKGRLMEGGRFERDGGAVPLQDAPGRKKGRKQREGGRREGYGF